MTTERMKGWTFVGTTEPPLPGETELQTSARWVHDGHTQEASRDATFKLSESQCQYRIVGASGWSKYKVYRRVE